MKIFSTEQIKKIERYTIDNEGISALQLVERVAEGIAAEVVEMLSAGSRIIIFAGPGNNGADALATARLLYAQGITPEVFLFNIGGSRLSIECAAAKAQLLEAVPNAIFTEVVKQFNRPQITASDIVIDGLFGTGLRDGLTGGFRELVKYIDDSGARVVSIDVPSGLFGDWNPNAIHRNVVHATLTLGVQFPHLCYFLADNAECIGRWKVLDIGLSASEIRKTQAPFFYVERDNVKQLLRPRPDFCSKADFGSALLIAGSYGMMGAAILAARGALRAGAGKVSVYAPRCGCEPLQAAVPEALYVCAPSDVHTSDIQLAHTYSAIAIGPGIGNNEATCDAVEKFVAGCKSPIVVDADALNCIARRQHILHRLPPLSILTPHAGEFDRIFGQQPSAEARLVKAIEMARYHNIIIVLKGRYTTIIRPDGKFYFNSTGNSGMATAGAGDVLTGVICSLLAQGYDPEVSAVCGAFIHGLAGDIAMETEGKYGLTAGDIAANVGRAIKVVLNN